MKSERQSRIIELITQFNIETQDEMMQRLRDEGFAVTQATVSRDLRELKLTKSLTPDGTYRYSVANARHHMSENTKISDAMANSILSVAHSMNNVVLKTYPGMAQAVASSVDAMSLPNILGSVAGDDTIIIVTNGESASKEVKDKLLLMMMRSSDNDKN